MSTSAHHITAPEDRVPIAHKLSYGLGAFVNNLLAAAIGGMTIVLNLGLGMNPALVGLLGALLGIAIAVIGLILATRGLQVLIALAVSEERAVYISYLLLGAILVVGGSAAMRRRSGTP